MTAVGQAGSGAQPWSNELSDNFMFIKALPFVLAFGFAVGLLMARSYGPKVRADGAVRRWSPGTGFGHAVLTLGFVLALPPGMWQDLGGILLALITITGLIKAARYLVPVPGFGLWLASTLHVAAMVAIVIKLLDHLRYTFPRWPLMASIATTWVRTGSPPARRQGATERGGSTAGG